MGAGTSTCHKGCEQIVQERRRVKRQSFCGCADLLGAASVLRDGRPTTVVPHALAGTAETTCTSAQNRCVGSDRQGSEQKICAQSLAGDCQLSARAEILRRGSGHCGQCDGEYACAQMRGAAPLKALA